MCQEATKRKEVRRHFDPICRNINILMSCYTNWLLGKTFYSQKKFSNANNPHNVSCSKRLIDTNSHEDRSSYSKGETTH